MTVRELKDKLAFVPDDAVVVIKPPDETDYCRVSIDPKPVVRTHFANGLLRGRSGTFMPKTSVTVRIL